MPPGQLFIVCACADYKGAYGVCCVQQNGGGCSRRIVAGINRSRQVHRASACMCIATPILERRAGLQVLRDDVLPHDCGAAALHEHHHAEPDRPGAPRPAPPRLQSALLHPPCWKPSVGEAHGETGLSMSGGGPGAAERKQLACRAQAVAGDFFAALGGSFTLGSAPAFNIARCLQDPTLAAFSSA